VWLRESIDTPLRTAVGLLVLPAALILTSAAAFALGLLGASTATVHRCYVGFARLCLRVAQTKLTVHGSDNIKPDQAYVVVANHTSSWDPPCLVAGLPHVFLRFVVKKELMRIPIFGQALQKTGNVKVVRTRTADDVARIREMMGHRAPEISMIFFAEGTRSRDGALHAFKMGAFATAIAFGLPILPIGLAGPFAVWPKGTVRLRRTPVAMEIGEPISCDELNLDDRAALRDRTHAAVSALRAQARQRLRDEGYDPGGPD
jgi:1-acyl-sn-glycerol-3-phosphate acyltransferase